MEASPHDLHIPRGYDMLLCMHPTMARQQHRDGRVGGPDVWMWLHHLDSFNCRQTGEGAREKR
ncbi:hypothetical protein DCC79_03340 [bacterium]|nr:hypothetical protein [Chloroflexi bacterium CFX6]RIL11925.1 MAG: hypothetical protein DCC79_03340 [bacterium]